jgi:hypothetical protein
MDSPLQSPLRRTYDRDWPEIDILATAINHLEGIRLPENIPLPEVTDAHLA